MIKFYINDEEITKEELNEKYTWQWDKEEEKHSYVNYKTIETFSKEEVIDYLNEIEGEDLWMSSNWKVKWYLENDLFVRATENNHLYRLKEE